VRFLGGEPRTSTCAIEASEYGPVSPADVNMWCSQCKNWYARSRWGTIRRVVMPFIAWSFPFFGSYLEILGLLRSASSNPNDLEGR